MVVLMAGPAAAQGWVEYTSQQDRFIVNFPGQPAVREIPYPTEFGITLSARVYTVEDGPITRPGNRFMRTGPRAARDIQTRARTAG
jgi:hypothetical protein